MLDVFEEGVHAGFASFVGDDETYRMSVEQYLIPRPKTTICVRIKGESMMDAGIMPGDLALVDTSLDAKKGDVVIAIVDGNYTIKSLERDSRGRMFLRASNKAYAPIYPKDDLAIFGVVVGIIRKYRT